MLEVMWVRRNWLSKDRSSTAMSDSPVLFRILSGDGSRSFRESSRGSLKDGLSASWKCPRPSCEINGSCSASHAIESSTIRVMSPIRPSTDAGPSIGEHPGVSVSQNDSSAGDNSPGSSPAVLSESSLASAEGRVNDDRPVPHVLNASNAVCKNDTFLLEYVCAARPSASYEIAV